MIPVYGPTQYIYISVWLLLNMSLHQMDSIIIEQRGLEMADKQQAYRVILFNLYTIFNGIMMEK